MALDPSWLDKDTMWETIASSIEEGIDKPAHSLWTRTERMELSDDDRTKKLASEWLVPFLIQENPALRKIMQERGLTTHDDRLRVAEVLMGLAARSAYLIYPNDRLKTERSLRQDSSFAGLLRNTPSLQGKKTPAPSRRMFGKRS